MGIYYPKQKEICGNYYKQK